MVRIKDGGSEPKKERCGVLGDRGVDFTIFQNAKYVYS